MKLFFIGICGISMSALACLAKAEGHEVMGSDKNYSSPPACLKGADIFPQPCLQGVEWADEIIYSSAIHEDCEELALARTLGKKTIVRGSFLGRISAGYEKVIAVSGSHGKTTTTAMIYHVLKVAGKHPTLHLGGILKDENSNVHLGDKEFFITEACEYHDNFLYLKPYIGVITNIEPEHLDYFKTFENEKQSYRKFQQNCESCIKTHNYHAKNIKINSEGQLAFEVYQGKSKIFDLQMKIGGKYNAKNALFCIDVCHKLGLSYCQIKLGLESFKGVKKRCEKIESSFPFQLFVDYGHHPKEIFESAKYFKAITKGKCIVVFQPHTYSRTRIFLENFVKSLSCFDQIICFKTYPAREEPCEGLDETALSKALRKSGKNSVACQNIDDLNNLLKGYCKDDVVVFLGAGDLPDKFFCN